MLQQPSDTKSGSESHYPKSPAAFDFLGQPPIVLRPVRIGRVLEDRLARSSVPRPAARCGESASGRSGRGPGRGLSRAPGRTRSTFWLTSVARRVLTSYMHSTTPLIFSRGFSRAATRLIVSSSLLSPCRARKCGCKGINTSSTATKALSVSTPSEGGQSIRR